MRTFTIATSCCGSRVAAAAASAEATRVRRLLMRRTRNKRPEGDPERKRGSRSARMNRQPRGRVRRPWLLTPGGKGRREERQRILTSTDLTDRGTPSLIRRMLTLGASASPSRASTWDQRLAIHSPSVPLPLSPSLEVHLRGTAAVGARQHDSTIIVARREGENEGMESEGKNEMRIAKRVLTRSAS